MLLRCATLGALACGDIAPHATALAQSSRAITQGNATEGHPAVVALATGREVYCSGVIVSPRVVVTAAHCLRGAPPEQVLVGASASSDDAKMLPVGGAWQHPSYRIGRADFDVGVLLLREAADVPPIPLNQQPLTEADIGMELALVGFGETSPSPTDGGADAAKRDGTALLEELSPAVLVLGPGPSLACHGDSGGPALGWIAERQVVVGILSKGDEECVESTRAVRADGDASAFLLSRVERIESEGLLLGEACIENRNCESDHCLAPPDAPAFPFCSQPCSGETPCAGGMRCEVMSSERSACVFPTPSPGALGADCTEDDDCQHGLCGAFTSEASPVCSKLCFPDVDDACPAGTECAPLGDPDTGWGCVDEASHETRGGCAISSKAPNPIQRTWWLLGLGVLWAARRGAPLTRRARASAFRLGQIHERDRRREQEGGEGYCSREGHAAGHGPTPHGSQ